MYWCPTARPMVSTLPTLLLLLLLLLLLTVGRASAAGAVVSAGNKLTTVEIAPGVAMPFANLGGSDGAQSNYTYGLAAGFRGFDTALSYTTGNVQPKLGAAIRRSSLARADLFVTTKIPCCPAASDGFQHYYCDGHPRSGSNLTVTAGADISSTLADIGIEYADLILLHWPCQTIEQTWQTYAPTPDWRQTETQTETERDIKDTLPVLCPPTPRVRLTQEIVGWRRYKALESALADGRARAIGISNFNASAIDALLSGTSVKPAFNQCGFSVGNHASQESPAGKDDVTRARCVCVSVCLSVSVCVSLSLRLAVSLCLHNMPRDRCRALNITYGAYSPLNHGKAMKDAAVRMLYILYDDTSLNCVVVALLHSWYYSVVYVYCWVRQVLQIAKARNVSSAVVALRCLTLPNRLFILPLICYSHLITRPIGRARWLVQAGHTFTTASMSEEYDVEDLSALDLVLTPEEMARLNAV